MSDLEEPPAKVLKIDNIDGVTHVTELSGFPETFIGEDHVVMGEESGIIEGGAEPEQEEWLSEGILTDDDYNPASQEAVEDRTDSQLGTGDEEHLDSTLDSEPPPNETEPNLNETYDDANEVDTEEDLDQSKALAGGPTSESEANVSQNEENGTEAEANVSVENGIHAENEADLPMSETSLNQSDTNANSEADMTQSIEHLMEMSNVDANIMESQTYTQECPMKFGKLEANVVKTGSASDIIIQRVITFNKNNNIKTDGKTSDIEETMKHLDGEKEEVKLDDFEKYLNKTTVPKSDLKKKPELKQEEKDDGNDTDYLLRMLGEDNNKGKKKLTKTVKEIRAGQDGDSSDDDDFVYEGSSVLKNLKAAKSALAKKQAMKAEPEDMEDGDDETEMSGDEVETMQKMFGYNSKTEVSGKAASRHVAAKRPPTTVLNIVERPSNVKTASRQYQNKRLVNSRAQSILKPATPDKKPAAAANSPHTILRVKNYIKPSETKAPTTFKPPGSFQTIDKKMEKKIEPSKTIIEPNKVKIEPGKIKTEPGRFNQHGKMTLLGRVKCEPGKMKLRPAKITIEPEKVKVGSGKITIEPDTRVGSWKITTEPEKMKVDPEEIIDEEEFLDDEDFRLDEDEFLESDNEVSERRQRIMRPEMMDEEVPSDGESASEDGSLYDELPSSESEDLDDWFTLDIRSERAGDYIPLLGPKAKELLLEEKRKVSARLSTLRQSHTALIASGKQQAATLRRATATLAELDDMLRAA